MIARLGQTLSRLSARFVPDPFVIVLTLTLLTFAISFLFGDKVAALSASERTLALADGWFADFYSTGLMKFALQMCIVLITGHALALSRPMQFLIKRVCGVAKTPGAAVVTVALVSAFASLLQWGLGVIVGAFMAREMGKHFAREGKAVHYPLLGAAGYAGFIVWHGGLSGSAPLKVAEPGHFLEAQIGVIPISETLFGPLNIAVTLTLIITIAGSLWALMPTDASEMTPYKGPLDESEEEEDGKEQEGAGDEPGRLIAILERTRVLNLVCGGALALWCVQFFARKGVAGFNLDTINMLFMTLGILLHRSPRSYLTAVIDGAKGSAGIILQFPFYFGILGLLKASGLITQVATMFVQISSATTFPLFTFLSAGLVNLFVPSGGGQWAVQGPVMMEAVKTLGVEPTRAIMAMAYGDAWTNMLQPFWALPLLGIMGLKAREIIGYTGFVLFVTGPVIMAWLLFL
ncbi:MAG: TIGR00366 family protein [Myxococcota bacterium]|nr:TIGR00366 family protein [Myxococcota bacterium]